MRPLLLDASVWLAALDRDDAHNGPSIELLKSAQREDITLAALDLTLYEVANVAVVRWRDLDAARHLVALIEACCPNSIETVSANLLDSAARHAQQSEITVYDAAYVAAADANDWSLVSCDLKDIVSKGHAITPKAAVAGR